MLILSAIRHFVRTLFIAFHRKKSLVSWLLNANEISFKLHNSDRYPEKLNFKEILQFVVLGYKCLDCLWLIYNGSGLFGSISLLHDGRDVFCCVLRLFGLEIAFPFSLTCVWLFLWLMLWFVLSLAFPAVNLFRHLTCLFFIYFSHYFFLHLLLFCIVVSLLFLFKLLSIWCAASVIFPTSAEMTETQKSCNWLELTPETRNLDL